MVKALLLFGMLVLIAPINSLSQSPTPSDSATVPLWRLKKCGEFYLSWQNCQQENDTLTALIMQYRQRNQRQADLIGMQDRQIETYKGLDEQNDTIISEQQRIIRREKRIKRIAVGIGIGGLLYGVLK